MKLLVTQPVLSEALQAASYFIPARTLSNAPAAAVLRGEENTLWVQCRDFGHSFQCNVPAEVIEAGEVRVPLRIISDVVRRLPPGSLMVSSADGSGGLTLSIGNSSYSIVTLGGTEMLEGPGNEEYPPDEIISLAGKDFKTMVSSTAFAASSDVSREMMTGVNMRLEGNYISMAAIDGVRLAYNRLSISKQVLVEMSAVVPAKLLEDVARIAQDKETVHVEFHSKTVCFRAGNYTIVTRTLEGKFPAYKEIINIEGGTSVLMSCSEFCDALERVSLFSKDSDRAVVLDLQRDKVVISSRSADVGSAREEVPAKVDGELFRISFNARYLLEGIRAFSGEDVLLRLTGPVSKACVQTPSSPEWADYRYILMPLRME